MRSCHPRIIGFAALLVCILSSGVYGQERSHFKLSISSASEVHVQAELAPHAKSWSFRNAYAGVLGIAERIHDFRAFTDHGSDAGARKIATGEFRSLQSAARISYTVKLPVPSAAGAAHVSWLAGNSALLMFADLLPQTLHNISAEFSLPSEWRAESTIAPDARGLYQVVEPDEAVFFVSRSLRRETKLVKGMALECVLDGTWPFKDAAVLKAAAKVLEKYFALTGFRLSGRSMVMIAPLPVSGGSLKWRAETRGSTVMLLLDASAQSGNWPGQLGVIFTHELLHLWVPNSLRFEGDYDWFFEGFTLYTALVTALELKLINFTEYLDTLARVYDSYLSHAQDISLIDASERRWTSSGSLVYDKGMLAAFLYDLIARQETQGKTGLADRYRELFRTRASGPANGNEAIISLLSVSPATAEFAKSYIESGSELRLERLLTSYGLVLETAGNSSRLTVAGQLTPEQKQLLRSLGYRK